jgi:Co/Zn/Cd efflux system component
MGGLDDADLLGVAWAMFAAAASLGLAVVAIAFARRPADEDQGEYCASYNALAPLLHQ